MYIVDLAVMKPTVGYRQWVNKLIVCSVVVSVQLFEKKKCLHWNGESGYPSSEKVEQTVMFG